jgi:hypothetical protein
MTLLAFPPVLSFRERFFLTASKKLFFDVFRGGKMERKNINFPVPEREHAQIKQLAAKQRRSIKQLFLDMLDKLHPGWDKDEKENDPK